MSDPIVTLATCADFPDLDDDDRGLPDALRARGIAADVAPTAAKFGKQIRFADRRGIPFVWFPGVGGAADSVKDIRSGEQVDADAATWMPDDGADLAPLVLAAGGPGA